MSKEYSTKPLVDKVYIEKRSRDIYKGVYYDVVEEFAGKTDNKHRLRTLSRDEAIQTARTIQEANPTLPVTELDKTI